MNNEDYSYLQDEEEDLFEFRGQHPMITRKNIKERRSKKMKCPDCGSTKLRYLGSPVLGQEGNWYGCHNCQLLFTKEDGNNDKNIT